MFFFFIEPRRKKKNSNVSTEQNSFKSIDEKMKLAVSVNAHKFFHDESERRKWQNPEAILAAIGLEKGSTFMDIGCGHGFFAIPAARIVGERGKVYGLDADGEAIAFLRKKALKEGLGNLVLQVGEAEDTVFCESCADFVFFGIVFHDFRDPARVLMNAKKMLRATGRLVDLDWKKEDMGIGPLPRIRFSDEEAANLIKSVGFTVETTRETGQYHYVVIAKSLLTPRYG
jgi:ubiquinone/menaquinone biosynthesis C-methylase UbiE